MYCRKCGRKLSDAAMFCPECGTPVKKPAAQEPVPRVQPVNESETSKQQSVSQQVVPPQQPVSQQVPVKEQKFEEKRQNESGKNRKILLIATGIIILLLVVIIFSLISKKNESKSEQAQTYQISDGGDKSSDENLSDRNTGKQTESGTDTAKPSSENVESPMDEASEYILPDSGTRLLTESDLEGLDPDQLRLARNEIYARHGRMFRDEQLQDYFNHCSWYSGTIAPEDFTDEMLTDIESANKDLIVEYEKKMGYR